MAWISSMSTATDLRPRSRVEETATIATHACARMPETMFTMASISTAMAGTVRIALPEAGERPFRLVAESHSSSLLGGLGSGDLSSFSRE